MTFELDSKVEDSQGKDSHLIWRSTPLRQEEGYPHHLTLQSP